MRRFSLSPLLLVLLSSRELGWRQTCRQVYNDWQRLRQRSAEALRWIAIKYSRF
jgi:hypothetical protein